ncbi:MAG: NAD(P)H-hydrate dehydratase [Bacteroidota bacterium]|nr:NAD(P)H-hydrate dehydratase [Bacteroidota bacterium]MDX5429419.1 NAD(P)H-hydrate dehydratase [Bacteroidota bacterium]MDX5468210.1 NAD(P)H-hydrate dehydratase [Bacteroidota bacterium]
MKLLNSQQIKEWDQQSIRTQGISSFMLMQRAAKSVFTYLRNQHFPDQKVAVCCGPGNNGGDGWLIAAYLVQHGYEVELFEHEAGKSADREQAKSYGQAMGIIEKPWQRFHPAEFDLLIDALFGHGVTRELTGEYLDWVHCINQSSSIYSIDVPSGMPTDLLETPFEDFVKGAFVLTFQSYKFSFFIEEYLQHIRDIHCLDIGLNQDFKTEEDLPDWVDTAFIEGFYQAKRAVSHKGTYGSSLLIGGCVDYPGAIGLAAGACLQSGVGKTFVSTPASVKLATLIRVPEAIYLNEAGSTYWHQSIDLSKYCAVGIGPGLGQDPKTQKAVQEIFQQEAHWVIDADGINLLAQSGAEPFGRVILTPHPGEFDRLTKKHDSHRERILSAKNLAMTRNWVIVLKTSVTMIFTPEGKIYVNTSGNAGLAKGGSGDVLCGLITGYLGRGYSVEEAALLGVYLHGLSAQSLAVERSLDGINASDLIPVIGQLAKQWED